MFDRPPPAKSLTERPSAQPVTDSVDRLCRLYDARLAEARGRLSPDHVRDLEALAGLFGLDTDRPAAQIWEELRRLILRQTSGRAEDVAPQPDEPEAPATDAERLTIMVVEDDADVAADLTALLTEAGHSVVGPFHSAAAAEAAAALHAIDAALLDINLSDGGSGVELAESLTRSWDVRIIFISGDTAAAARHAHLAEAVVLKPYTGPQILAAVARLGRT
jgi:two-component system, response regulator PdtaR